MIPTTQRIEMLRRVRWKQDHLHNYQDWPNDKEMRTKLWQMDGALVQNSDRAFFGCTCEPTLVEIHDKRWHWLLPQPFDSVNCDPNKQ